MGDNVMQEQQDPEINEVPNAVALLAADNVKFPAIILPWGPDLFVHINRSTMVSTLRAFIANHHTVGVEPNQVEMMAGTLVMKDQFRVEQFIPPVGFFTLIKVKVHSGGPGGGKKKYGGGTIHVAGMKIMPAGNRGGRKWWRGGRGGGGGRGGMAA